jgi:hypothetical protein
MEGGGERVCGDAPLSLDEAALDGGGKGQGVRDTVGQELVGAEDLERLEVGEQLMSKTRWSVAQRRER